MYRDFFGLRASPFGSGPDPRFLYVMPQTREALSCLQYGIADRKGFVVMTGEAGTGKTTLLKTVLGTFCKDRVVSAFVFNPRLEVLDFFEFVLADFGIPVTSRTKSGMLMQLNRWLIERHRDGRLCVIIVDEAQNLSWELLEEIRLLTNLESSSEKLLQIVLSGQPELENTLRDPKLRQLRQRVCLWCKTQTLTATQTEAYIGERLRIAGASSPAFSKEAVELIYWFSKGIPRVINLICEHALIGAYVEQIKQVPSRIVEAVSIDLDLVDHPLELSDVDRARPESTLSIDAVGGTTLVSDSSDLVKFSSSLSHAAEAPTCVVDVSSVDLAPYREPILAKVSPLRSAVRSIRSTFSLISRKPN
jgi:type II secretory pathway predicted ATPase ExeA